MLQLIVVRCRAIGLSHEHVIPTYPILIPNPNNGPLLFGHEQLTKQSVDLQGPLHTIGSQFTINFAGYNHTYSPGSPYFGG